MLGAFSFLTFVASVPLAAATRQTNRGPSVPNSFLQYSSQIDQLYLQYAKEFLGLNKLYSRGKDYTAKTYPSIIWGWRPIAPHLIYNERDISNVNGVTRVDLAKRYADAMLFIAKGVKDYDFDLYKALSYNLVVARKYCGENENPDDFHLEPHPDYPETSGIMRDSRFEDSAWIYVSNTRVFEDLLLPTRQKMVEFRKEAYPKEYKQYLKSF